ncbi:methyl-accepting chemotaxis protein [Paraburkholderia sp. 22B1P]|uniref:methyl-accepting chemotaxis protein n=1 Tax=Paraburkholderia sp. 22B1P TaxID=3080498 RepID=UPI00308CE404|nr:methyl-accepting chemotaxis protein [Paraburkholderia sp. 22B1P]
MNKGITIKARIGLTMAFVVALLAVITVLGLLGIGRSNAELQDVYTNQMPSAVDIGNAELSALRERLALDRAAFQIGTPEATVTLERARSVREISEEWWKRYLALPRDAEEDRQAQDVASKRLALHQAMDEFYTTIAANDRGKIVDGEQRIQAAYSELSVADVALSNIQFDQARKGFNGAQSQYVMFCWVSIVALIIGLGAAFVSYATLRAAIGRPLAEALAHFAAIATGDLRHSIVVQTRDEMGQLLSGIAGMQNRLADTVKTVRAGSEAIATATRQIAAGNIDLSSRTEEQASALQETASSMEQLTGTVKQNADNAQQASSLATRASEIANRGNVVVGQVVGTMGAINQSSAKIADIISIIEGIAFQTNILALNAAVEAARAGEEGRGFAVVAGEVRNLAQRSSVAAKEIKELIDDSLQSVQTGSKLVDEAGRTMTEIIDAVRSVTDIMGEVAAASQEQSSGIEEVARAVAQMDEVTQQNAALVEEAAAAASSLEEQTGRLRTIVSVFEVAETDVVGTSGTAVAAPQPAATITFGVATNN